MIEWWSVSNVCIVPLWCALFCSSLVFLAAQHLFKLHWTLKGILLGKENLEGKSISLLLVWQFLCPSQCFHTSHVPGLLLKKCSWNCTFSFPQSGMTILTEGFISTVSKKNMVWSPFWEPSSWSLHRILLNRIHSIQLTAVRNLCKVAVDDSQMFWPGCPQCYYEVLSLCSPISEILPRGDNMEGSQWL